ncbi:hypothetical protein RchiOBHm_Chr2g0111991 [Rosa chinensis]|uniref:Uncharacterized protein n=1 Tax=Rosa chinensis TaxID=74649 RepID=A0A2P6RQ32_ROSCH|nr:hypothetical protein RchiOBHm_Chr2g0111991 [Rosa chinensis]
MKGYNGLKPFMMTTSFHKDNSNSLSHLMHQNFKNSTFESNSLVAEEEYFKGSGQSNCEVSFDHDSTVSLCDSCTRMVFFRLGDI